MKKFLTAALAASLTITLTACNPVSLLNQLLVDENANDPKIESAAEQRREELEGYGYKALQTDEERRVYSILDVSLTEGGNPHFVINNDGTLDNMGNILEMYKSDHPEVFWIDDSYGYEYVSYATYTEIDVLISMQDSELSKAKEEFNEAVDRILNDMPDGLSDYEKELYINDTLLDRCEYDDEAAKKDKVIGNEQNAYGALVDGKAVCEGYTRAFQLLCQKAGIDCVPINGTCESDSPMGGNHIWNAVCLEGEWYYVDSTWNDFQPEDSEYMLTDIERHLYFNVTTERIKQDHTISPVYGEESDMDYCNAYVPECTAEKYNYFNYSVPLLSDLDDCYEFEEALSLAVEQGRDTFEFRIDDSLDYDGTVEKIIDSYALDWFDYSNSVNDEGHQLGDGCMVYSYKELNVAAFSLEYE